MLQFLQSDTDKLQSLILPDSVQKANLAKAVEKIEDLSTMDYRQLLTNLAQEAGWVLLKIALALLIYFIGKQRFTRKERFLDRIGIKATFFFAIGHVR